LLILINFITLLNKGKWFLIFGFLASIIFYFFTFDTNQIISIDPTIRFPIVYLAIFSFGILIGLLSDLDRLKPIFWYGFLLALFQFLIILIIVQIEIIYFDVYVDFSFAIGANMLFAFICYFPMNSIGIFIGNKIKNKLI